jgi:UDP:flavonoid glycosyltransferase YjiC (YdhE family)
VLTERGHEVVFAGRPEMVPRVQAAKLRAIEITRAYEQVDRYPQGSFLTRMSCYLTSPMVEQQVREIVAAEAPGLILIDCMFPAALAQLPDFACRSAIFCHTFVFRQLDMWRGMIATLDGMRQKAGYSALPPMDILWRGADRLISTSFSEFDFPPNPDWAHVRHVGPVLEDETVAVPTTLPWPNDDPTPLVLVSYSTGFEQRNVAKLQRTLDGLSDLPVHVVATTGGIVEPEELTVPANATVLRYAAHDPILARASLVVMHGGHGTAMRAMRAGVPGVVIPGLAGDQPFVAAAIQEWGAGRALPGDADTAAIRNAARDVLSEPYYQKNARLRSQAFTGHNGAERAADEVEGLLVRASA